MKTPVKHRAGFTLLELLVAMVVTTIIVTVLVSITSIAIDVWNRSRAELRASRQAKAMVDTLARDFESLVLRTGNDFEWLNVRVQPPDNSSNAAKMIYFTAATDRYNGEIGTAEDLGGDVSCVGYQLDWSDPLATGSGGDFETFVLYRRLVNPKEAFDNLLGETDLNQAFNSVSGQIEDEGNFVCENIFQFTITFHLEVPSATPGNPPEQELLVIEPTGGTSEFRITGHGIVTVPARDELRSAKLKSVGISLTVLADSGIDQLRNTPARAEDAAWLAKNSYQYSKLVHLPGM
ncbi:MAG TPA: prepilin-type N-terminal cleavage/methylation domain-containing protein [Luteolibacter sp.]|nr:prepilin-type N-terminal cleavage/methylation domain-containing protein [Luteolibacter sp.]